jgi:spoIIIJ-associated protein
MGNLMGLQALHQIRRQEIMDKIEISSKTIEDAIEVALRELDAERAEVAIEIVNQGRTGLFGIGSEDAKVRVVRLSPEEGLASQAVEIVTKLLSAMGASAMATIRFAGNAEVGPAIDIFGEDSGLLIGKRGESLRSFQFLVNLILSSKVHRHPVVTIDVEQYKERRNRSLTTMANRMAERVMSSGRAITLEPMSAFDRRIIHVALAEHAYVTTESFGEGRDRQVQVRLGTTNQ